MSVPGGGHRCRGGAQRHQRPLLPRHHRQVSVRPASSLPLLLLCDWCWFSFDAFLFDLSDCLYLYFVKHNRSKIHWYRISPRRPTNLNTPCLATGPPQATPPEAASPPQAPHITPSVGVSQKQATVAHRDQCVTLLFLAPVCR